MLLPGAYQRLPDARPTAYVKAMRTLFAVLLSAVFASAQAAASSVFVVNSNDANVDMIDLATHQITKTIPLLREPHHLVLSPDGKSLVVGDTTGNALFFLDPVTGDIQRRVTVSDPYQLQYSPNGNLLTTAGLARNQIDIYDAHSYKLLHSRAGAQHAEPYCLRAGFIRGVRQLAGHQRADRHSYC